MTKKTAEELEKSRRKLEPGAVKLKLFIKEVIEKGKERGISRKDLADCLGVTYPDGLSSIERRAAWNFNHLTRFCQLYDVRVIPIKEIMDGLWGQEIFETKEAKVRRLKSFISSANSAEADELIEDLINQK